MYFMYMIHNTVHNKATWCTYRRIHYDPQTSLSQLPSEECRRCVRSIVSLFAKLVSVRLIIDNVRGKQLLVQYVHLALKKECGTKIITFFVWDGFRI